MAYRDVHIGALYKKNLFYTIIIMDATNQFVDENCKKGTEKITIEKIC